MSVPGVSLISASIDKFQCEKRRDYNLVNRTKKYYPVMILQV